MSAGELLLEIRAEEIPARMLPDAVRELSTRLFEELVKVGLTPGEVETGFTPRRLWLVMKKLPQKGRDQVLPIVGPPASAAFAADGTPTRAAEGFASKLGLDVSQLKRRDFDPGEDEREWLQREPAVALNAAAEELPAAKPVKARGEYAYVVARLDGRRTREVLAELVPSILRSLSWPKTMRWGSGIGPWVRPIHGIVCVFEGEVVPFDLFGVASGRTSAGHPILSPEPFAVAGAASWHAALVARRIVPTPEAREAALRAGMEERAREHVGELVDDPALLAKLAAICEIPGILEGGFDPELLELPREVLVTALRDHQSALSVERDGNLLPMFLTVMDRPDDDEGHVRAGNEWVVAARLADARFFWTKDRATPLAGRVEQLGQLAFHERLGSVADKTARLRALARTIAASVGADAAAAERAAELAKADLVTEMVREFTSLQGVVGGIYAREDGEPEPVWQAVYDQYRPAGAEDDLPRGDVGRVLALADRLDTLVGFFALGRKFWPSGSRDPFGLRRAATGVVRLAIEGGLDLDLAATLGVATELYGDPTAGWPDLQSSAGDGDAAGKKRKQPAIEWKPGHALAGATPLADFLWDRAEYLLGLRGLAYDEIDAARGATGIREALGFRDALACARALQRARVDASFLAVALAAKRIANIVEAQPESALDPERLELEAERELHAAAGAFAHELDGALARQDFAAGFAAIGQLAPALERFFEDVLVMDPDAAKRANRLALLQSLHAAILRLADLSQLAIDKSEYR